MKTKVTKVLMGLMLSICSFLVNAQCASTVTGLNVYDDGSGSGILGLTPVINGSVDSATTNYYWNITPNAQPFFILGPNSFPAPFIFPSNGTYTVCLHFTDSVAMCTSNQYCTVITVTNSPNNCDAQFTYYTDSSCVTHFQNSSIGNNLTYSWLINNQPFSIENPNVVLPNGWNQAILYTYSNGSFCDSSYININVNCNANPSGCDASFTYSVDSNCVAHFTNTSTGSNLTYQWYNFTTNTVFSTQQSPSLVLDSVGNYIALFTYSNGQFCDSLSLNVYCPTGPCHASFTYYTDTIDCSTHFINTSTGMFDSYYWSVGNTLYAPTVQQINIPNGQHVVHFYLESGNNLCDVLETTITVNCPGGSTICEANSYFTLFADSVNAGNFFVYNNSSGTGSVSYLWDFGDGTSSTQQYPVHQYAVPGQYIICLTVTGTQDSTSCSQSYCDSSSVYRMAAGFLMNKITVLSATTTGLKQNREWVDVSVFPNPMKEALTIEINSNESYEKLNVSLIDALGKQVFIEKIGENRTQINTSQLDRGFYFLIILNEKGKNLKAIKLIK